MAIALNKFGNIFENGGVYYVFFASTLVDKEVRIFAAQILNEEKTKLYQAMADRHESRPNSRMKDSLTLCFVILTTKDFEGRAATFHRTGDNVSPESQLNFLPGKTLNEMDIKELKKTILNDAAMPAILKTLIQETQ